MIGKEDITELKELNKNILEKSMSKVKESLENGAWDCECFDTMNDSIENLVSLSKLEKYTDKQETEKAIVAKKMDAKTDITEFEQLVYDISEKLEGKEGMLSLTTTIAEVVEDMKIINPRLYASLIKKLKELL